MSEPVKIIAQLHSVRTTSDGGGKITLEFGYDSLEGVLELQRLNSQGQTSLALAIVPFDNQIDKIPYK